MRHLLKIRGYVTTDCANLLEPTLGCITPDAQSALDKIARGKLDIQIDDLMIRILIRKMVVTLKPLLYTFWTAAPTDIVLVLLPEEHGFITRNGNTVEYYPYVPKAAKPRKYLNGLESISIQCGHSYGDGVHRINKNCTVGDGSHINFRDYIYRFRLEQLFFKIIQNLTI